MIREAVDWIWQTVRVEPTRARLAVVQFPGTNCERETVRALTDVLACPVDLIWHADALDPEPYAAVVLPGGFAHGEGNYTASSPVELERLEASGAVVLRYCDADGRVTPEANPNGSANNIAAIGSGSVLGLMPHPERATDRLLGSADGRLLFASIGQALADMASHTRYTGVTGVTATRPEVSLNV